MRPIVPAFQASVIEVFPFRWLTPPASIVPALRASSRTNIGNVSVSRFQIQQLGTWNLELGTWNFELGTWNLELGTWNLELSTEGLQPVHLRCVSASYEVAFSHHRCQLRARVPRTRSVSTQTRIDFPHAPDSSRCSLCFQPQPLLRWPAMAAHGER